MNIDGFGSLIGISGQINTQLVTTTCTNEGRATAGPCTTTITSLIYCACDYNLQIIIMHRLAFSVTLFTALLGSGFQQCSPRLQCPTAFVLAGWHLSATAPELN
jgi:hypothetical protein